MICSETVIIGQFNLLLFCRVRDVDRTATEIDRQCKEGQLSFYFCKNQLQYVIVYNKEHTQIIFLKMSFMCMQLKSELEAFQDMPCFAVAVSADKDEAQ